MLRYIAACVCLDCVPREPVILKAPTPIAPAPDELSNPCYAMHPGMKCACKGVELCGGNVAPMAHAGTLRPWRIFSGAL